MALIVMTGATSGLGAVAARRFVDGANRLLVGARKESSHAAAISLDLANLESARAFAAQVGKAAGSASIDALVLNAGGYARGRTVEGYEATFVTNYLSHYLLLRLLWGRLSAGATVLLTTSGTHDPAERTVVPPPLHANARWLANPDLDPNHDKAPRVAAMRAYSSSKLCIVLLTRALAARSDTRDRKLRVIAYDPGPTPGTRLVRELGTPISFLWTSLAGPLRLLMRGANTVEDAGNALADLVLEKVRPPDGRLYAALRRGKLTWPDPSELARRDDLMHALWRDSAQFVALPE